MKYTSRINLVPVLSVAAAALGFASCALAARPLPTPPTPMLQAKAETASAHPQSMAPWFDGGIAGKKIVAWGNSTIANAYSFFDTLCDQAIPGGLLEGVECRTDLLGVQADAHQNVTVTLAAPVTYQVGQWVSVRFASGEDMTRFWQPSVRITAVEGNTFTYHRPYAPRTDYTEDSGRASGSILDYGTNGATLASLLTGSGPFSSKGVCDAKPDLLIVRGPLINDVRQGRTDLSQAKQLEAQMLALFASCLPKTAILLTTENSFLASDTGQHQVQPNADAQEYTNILRAAPLAMTGSYPNLNVLDVMQAIYGVRCPASSELMANQIHPSAIGQVKEANYLLRFIGFPPLQTVASFNIRGTPVTLRPGQSTENTSTITVTSTQGFYGSVALSATVASGPPGYVDPPAFSFGSPASVTIAKPGTAYLTISTAAPRATSLYRPVPRGAPWLAGGGTALGCLVLLGVPARRRTWLRMLAAIAILASFIGGVSACGSNRSVHSSNAAGTTPGDYIITVTGSASRTSDQGTVNLTVE